MHAIHQISSFFGKQTEPILDDLGRVAGRATKFELLAYNHLEKILAAAAVGVGVVSFYAVKNIIAPGIAKIVTAAKPYFDKFKKFSEEHSTLIKGVVSLGVVGLTTYSAFKIFTAYRDFQVFRIQQAYAEYLA